MTGHLRIKARTLALIALGVFIGLCLGVMIADPGQPGLVGDDDFWSFFVGVLIGIIFSVSLVFNEFRQNTKRDDP